MVSDYSYYTAFHIRTYIYLHSYCFAKYYNSNSWIFNIFKFGSKYHNPRKELIIKSCRYEKCEKLFYTTIYIFVSYLFYQRIMLFIFDYQIFYKYMYVTVDHFLLFYLNYFNNYTYNYIKYKILKQGTINFDIFCIYQLTLQTITVCVYSLEGMRMTIRDCLNRLLEHIYYQTNAICFAWC